MKQDASIESFGLSYQQQALWLLAQLAPPADRNALNLCYEFRFRGSVNIEALRGAVRKLIRRHSILGMRIYEQQGDVRQRSGHRVHVKLRDFRSDSNPADEADAHATNLAAKRLNIESGGPLAMFDLLRVGDHDTRLLVNLHHLIADGRSIEILKHDLAALYSNLVQCSESTLPPKSCSYRDFVAAQFARQGGCSFSNDEDYWTNELSSEARMLDLRPDFPQPQRRSFRGSQVEVTIDPDLIAVCRRKSFRERVPFSVFMLAAFVKLLIHRSHQSEIVIGTSFTGRHPDSAWREAVGLYANTLPMRFNPGPAAKNSEFLQHVNRKYTEAHDHQDYPLQLLLAHCTGLRDVRRPSLFPAAFNFQHAVCEDKVWAGGLNCESKRIYTPTTLLELVVHVTAGKQATFLTVDYCTNLFSKYTVIALTAKYNQILQQLCRDGVGTQAGLRRSVGPLVRSTDT